MIYLTKQLVFTEYKDTFKNQNHKFNHNNMNCRHELPFFKYVKEYVFMTLLHLHISPRIAVIKHFFEGLVTIKYVFNSLSLGR